MIGAAGAYAPSVAETHSGLVFFVDAAFLTGSWAFPELISMPDGYG